MRDITEIGQEKYLIAENREGGTRKEEQKIRSRLQNHKSLINKIGLNCC